MELSWFLICVVSSLLSLHIAHMLWFGLAQVRLHPATSSYYFLLGLDSSILVLFFFIIILLRDKCIWIKNFSRTKTKVWMFSDEIFKVHLYNDDLPLYKISCSAADGGNFVIISRVFIYQFSVSAKLTGLIWPEFTFWSGKWRSGVN